MRAARAGDRPTFAKLLTAHLGDLADLQVVEEAWPAYDHVNVQVGARRVARPRGPRPPAGGDGRTSGTASFGLSDLLKCRGARRQPVPGNVGWTNLASGPDGAGPAGRARGPVPRQRSGDGPVGDPAARPRTPTMGGGRPAARRRRPAGAADAIAADDPSPGPGAQRVPRPGHLVRPRHVRRARDGLQLPSRSDAHGGRRHPAGGDARRRSTGRSWGSPRHRERLLAARQHLKRGLLLYGPPGRGQDAHGAVPVSQLDGVTIVQLTGDSLRLIGTACSVARTLQPAMIVVEDVDLIARGPRHAPRASSAALPAAQRDGRPRRGRRRGVPADHEPCRPARAGARRPAGTGRPGGALDLPDAEGRRGCSSSTGARSPSTGRRWSRSSSGPRA